MDRLDLRLDRSTDVPLGTQLAWKIRGAIAERALRPGDRLPGVREVAEAAGVNVNTVRSVFARLADQGLLESVHGRGTYVARDAREEHDLSELAVAAARDARRRGVDPRELAAVIYASAGVSDTAAGRRALRTRIEALEHEVARLEQDLAPDPAAAPARSSRRGPRLLSAQELAAVADELEARRADLRRQLRGPTPEPAPLDPPPPAPAANESRAWLAWPELLPPAPA